MGIKIRWSCSSRNELMREIRLSQKIVKAQNISTHLPIILNKHGFMKEYQVLPLSSML